MTATTIRIVRPPVQPPAARRRPSRPKIRAWVLVDPVLGAVVGSAVLAVSYVVAQNDASGWRYPLYWIGMLFAFLPASARLLDRKMSEWERTALVVLLAVITYLPRLLRGIDRPVFTDELLHWYQASRMDSGSGLFINNPVVSAIGHYPVFEATIVLLHTMTRLPIWISGIVLVGLAHTALLLGVRALARELTGKPRLADTAAVIYATAPAFCFHTVLMSYESLGMPLMAWTLVVAVRATRTSAWWPLVLAIFLILLTTMTHALSSMFMLLFLGLFAAGAVLSGIRRRSRSWRAILVFSGLFGLGVGCSALWVSLQNWNVFTYLLPPGSSISAIFSGSKSTPHVPFSGGELPPYEIIAGFLAPVAIALLCFVGFFFARQEFAARPYVPWIIGIVCALYPVTFVGGFNLVLGEWMHRPWPFLYIGLSILAAAGVGHLAARKTEVSPSLRGTSRYARMMAAAIIVGITVLLIGNTADSASDQYRFPGGWIAGSDTRVSTPELITAAKWLRQTAGADARILSDKDTSNNLLAYAWAIPVQPVATWELTETEKPVSKATLARMYEKGVQYVVVDMRMSTTLNARGYWYGNRDPQAFKQTTPFSAVAVTKLRTVPWASQVYASEHLRIYRIDHTALATAAGITTTGR